MKVPKIVKVRFCSNTGCPKQRNCYKKLGIHPYPCVVRRVNSLVYKVLDKILVRENHENT